MFMDKTKKFIQEIRDHTKEHVDGVDVNAIEKARKKLENAAEELEKLSKKTTKEELRERHRMTNNK